jgi:hypothetical protein
MPAPLALLGSLATLGRGAMIARSVTPMVSRLSLNRFGMGRVFPFLKDTLKKGGELIKRGGKGLAKRIPSALAFLGLNKFGNNAGEEGGEFLQPEQNGGVLSERGVGGSSEALGAALPSLRSANIPSLPSYKSGKEGETTAKLLSIAIKYLAGIDATLKNQLDVQRASFTQTNQAAREKSLEGSDIEGGRPTSSIVSRMKSAGGGILSFFSSMLMKTLLLTAPLIIKKISDMVDGFDFGFGDDEKETKPTSSVTPQTGMTDSRTPTERKNAVKSVRNNNPGNLRFANQKAAIGKDKDGFAIFATPEDGLKAMQRQVELDTQSRGLTLEKFINKYAPPNENVTSKYVEFVSSKTGIQPNANVPSEKIPDVMNAMIMMEGGKEASRYFSQSMSSSPAPVASARINEAAVDSAVRGNGSAAATPPSVVVAQNAPPPQSTTVTGAGPGSPSSPYNPSTMMDFTKYFSPMPA